MTWAKGQTGTPGARPPVTVVCDHCGVTFTKHVCKLRPRNFCSKACYGASLVGSKRSDETRARMSEAQQGERSNTWKGGFSRAYRRGYRSEQYKRWRSAVFERDDYTCRECGARGSYITAHHIVPWVQSSELRYEVDNGITLCEPCHAKRDNYYVRLHHKTTKDVCCVRMD